MSKRGSFKNEAQFLSSSVRWFFIALMNNDYNFYSLNLEIKAQTFPLELIIKLESERNRAISNIVVFSVKKLASQRII